MRKPIILFVALGLIFFLAKGWWDSSLANISQDKSSKVFVIAKGAGVSEIAKKLKQENLIKSELAFKIYVRQNNLTNKLQAGSYKLSPSMSMPEILKTLQVGSEDIWVTLIEGWRLEEMAQEISTKYQVPSSKFLSLAKEGYMFPDTYLFPKEVSAENITDTLKETFEKRFDSELIDKVKKLGLTKAEAVNLASIVEREARSAGARQMVASILLKRLKIGMGLNADATIQYALGYQKEEKSWWKRHLSRDDLQINSPYNTYLYAGLPPTPIANPGLSSLQAVANADPETPYLYYYHDSKGRSYYAKTLEEHNKNVSDYP